ncbi:transposase domain-containing protein [Rhizophagus clarus]|uniref:Transposase domain-containing protein n=1 Tax=Rhizophagus clarus TaxID=94130 RepID=A0A8H3M4L7_9GLOM|nr:transposase domain-containing protein [Rhizophagus clarus]
MFYIDSENNFNVNEDHEGDEYNYERRTEQFGDDIFFQYDDKDDMVTTDKSCDSDDDGNNSYDDSDNNNDNDSVNSSSKGSASEFNSDNEMNDIFSDLSLEDDEFLGSSLGNNEDEFSEDLFLNVLKLLEIKQKHNLSDRAFNKILSIFTNNEISLYAVKKKLLKFVNIMPEFIDICVNSCMAFTGQYENESSCHYCSEPRFFDDNKRKSRKVLSYFSLIDRFKIQYNDPVRSQLLRYRYEYINNENYDNSNNIGDIFDGNLYKELVNEGFFSNERDIVLIGSTDGYQIFRQKTDDCWIIMFINANLPPFERVKKENLLLSMIIPGPRQPKNFNSFLKPVVDELKLLEDGVMMYDGLLKEDFLLRSHIIMWTGDIPAITKIMCLSGHNSYTACRFCYLRGVYCSSRRHIYYPCNMPTHYENLSVNPSNLNKRTEENYKRDILLVENEHQITLKKENIKNTGITARSILLNLKSLKFPRAFPVDIMHLFFENISINMFKHWSGTFFKSGNGENYIISNAIWKVIAKEWSDWITIYSMPMLKNKLPHIYLKAWSNFVKTVRLCLQRNITKDDLNQIQNLLLDFYIHYENYYYKKEEDRLPAILISFHYLLHVADCIADCGPCWVFWQYPMERLCGMLLPLVHNRSLPYSNLTNNVHLLEIFNHLLFIPSLSHKYLNKFPIIPKSYPSSKVFTLDDKNEELYWPSKACNLNPSEMRALKQFYSELFNIPKHSLPTILSDVRKYGRLRTKDRHFISSYWIKRNDNISRNNYCVNVQMYEDLELYGRVEYFCSHSYIDVEYIDRCVGFMRIENTFYILDKENQVVYE